MTHEVRTLAQLEALYGTPGEASLRKVSDKLTPAYQKMIEAAPFFALATIGQEGLDCSPRGDQGQAVTILDAKTIAIPDRRGNNRLDPITIIKVTIGELYFQCARAIIRSGIWDASTQKDRKSLPSAGDMTKSAFQEFDAISYDQDLSARQAKTLY